MLPLLALPLLATGLCPGIAQAKWPSPAAGGSRSGDPEVIFTFDDGPHETVTAVVLDELARRGLKATFFWVGHRIRKQSRHQRTRLALVERAIAEGHVVANHTINHVHLCSTPPAEADHEIDENRRLYEEITGLPMLWFRAPYGDDCSRLRKALSDRGLSHFHWDIDPREWLSQDADHTADYVIAKLRKLEGRAVVLMHDTKRATVRAFPLILDWIERENQRRRERGERQIRIVTGSDVAAEQLAPALDDWLSSTAALAAGRTHDALHRLVPGNPPSKLSQR